MTEIAGQVLDVSDLARDLVNDAGTGMFQPPIKLVCTGAGLDYHVVVSGQESIWTYWRQVP
jgi:hypothetical protein